MTCKEALIKRIDLFLDECGFISPWIFQEQVNAHLIRNASSVKLRQNEVLYLQGEEANALYYVAKGRMRIAFINQSGRERCVMIAEEGALLGEASILDHYHHRTSATAITDVHLGRLGKDEVKALAQAEPEVMVELLKSLAVKRDVLRSHLESASINSLARIAISLLALVIRYGQFSDEGMMISIRFTHEELANLQNLNRVTVSKGLGKLASLGLISTDRSRVYIRSVDGLMDIVRRESKK